MTDSTAIGNTSDPIWMDASRKWAQDQKNIDKSYVADASTVSQGSKVDVYHAEFKSQYEQLFGLRKGKVHWAEFFPPEAFFNLKNRLFTYTLVPSLGTPETLKKLQNSLDPKMEGSKEISQMISRVLDLSDVLAEFNVRRNQFQRG